MKTVVIVQARSGSSRLPGKIWLPLAGKPLLLRMLERVRAARTPFDLVVATTTDQSDDGVAVLAEAAGYDCHRGDPLDLLDRHYAAAKARGADVVVKIPSDCPLIDPEVIDLVLSRFFGGSGAHGTPSRQGFGEAPGPFDFVSNLHPPTYPDGNDVEVMSFKALETAWREATKPHEREHTTPFLWDQPQRFRTANVTWPTGLDASMTHRFTIDYQEDYAFIQSVFERLYKPENPIFSLNDILALLEREPALRAINARYLGVNWYRHHLADLRTVSSSDTRLPQEETEN